MKAAPQGDVDDGLLALLEYEPSSKEYGEEERKKELEHRAKMDKYEQEHQEKRRLEPEALAKAREKARKRKLNAELVAKLSASARMEKWTRDSDEWYQRWLEDYEEEKKKARMSEKELEDLIE